MTQVKSQQAPRSPSLTRTFPSKIDLLARVFALEEDGHASKLFRAIRVGQSAIERYESRDWAVIKGREAWDRVLRLAVDSVEAPGPHWVRGAGDRDAWKVSSFSLIYFCIYLFPGLFFSCSLSFTHRSRPHFVKVFAPHLRLYRRIFLFTS